MKMKTGIPERAYGLVGFDFRKYLKNNRGFLAIKLGATVMDEKYDYQNDQTTYSTRYTEQELIVQSTDLGITAMEGYKNSSIWVNSVTNGTSISGVEVSMYEGNEIVGTCITNSEGFCKIPKSEYLKKPIYFANKNGEDQSFLITGSGNYMYSLNSYYSRELAKRESFGEIFYDRRLYRPGDVVHLKAILKSIRNDTSELESISNEKVQLIVTNPKGDPIYRKIVSSNSQGGANWSFTVPKDDTLGHYSATIKNPDSKSNLVSSTFQVEEFKPAAFSVDFTELPKTGVVGEKYKISIKGKYLFGTPLSEAEVSYNIMRYPIDYQTVPGYESFSFGTHEYGYYGYGSSDSEGQFDSGTGKLDEKGNYDLDLEPTPKLQELKLSDKTISLANPYRLKLEVSVKDVDSTTISKVQNILVYNSQQLLGLKVDKSYEELGSSFKISMVSVPIPGAKSSKQKAKLTIIHEDWSSVSSEGSGYSSYYRNQLTLREVLSKDFDLSKNEQTFVFKPEKNGYFKLILWDEITKTFARREIYVYKPYLYSSWDFRSDGSVEISKDKQIYKPGDVAKFIVRSPFPKGRMLVSVVGASNLWEKSIPFVGNMVPIEVPIQQSFLPKVYLNVAVIKPRMGFPKDGKPGDKEEFEKSDLGFPNIKVGTTDILVDYSSRISPLEIKLDRSKYAPGDLVKLEIRSKPNSELTVSVADRGVLDLIGYEYKNPANRFYENRNLGVSIFDSRIALIRQFKFYTILKDSNPGGDFYNDSSGSGGFAFAEEDGERKNFKYTAYWNPSLFTDAEGVAKVEFTLPDNLTTFKVMVVSNNIDTFSSANKEFQVTKPVILQKTLPSFVRLNDNLEVGGILINQTGVDSMFKFKIESDGLSIDELERVVELKNGERKEMLVKVNMTPENYATIKSKTKIGSPEFTATLTAEPIMNKNLEKLNLSKSSLRDRVKIKIPIKEWESISNHLSGTFIENHKVDLNLPSKDSVLPNSGMFQLDLSNTILVGLKNAFNFYQANPYMCMEQRSSAFLLTISSGSLLKEFSFTPPKDEGYDFKNIEKLFLGEMKEFQNEDGSFRLWKPPASYGYPYLTAHVVYIMTLAKERGYKVDQQILEKAISYLKSYLLKPEKDQYEMKNSLALIYYSFVKLGIDTSSIEKTLFENVSKLSPKSKGHFLLGLIQKRKITDINSDKEVKSLVDDLKSIVSLSEKGFNLSKLENRSFSYSYETPASVLALLMRIMIQIERSNPVIPKMVQSILEDRSGRGYWDDSHSVASIAFAISEYRQAYEKSSSKQTRLEVQVNSKKFVERLFGEKPTSTQDKLTFYSAENYPPKTLLPVSFNYLNGDSRMYYVLSFFYKPTNPNIVKERSNGIKITKEISKLDYSSGKIKESKVSNNTLVRGETYLVRLKIENPSRASNFVLVDPIPSNAEIVNTAFLTNQIWKDIFPEKPNYDYGEYEWLESSKELIEYREDRVVITAEFLGAGDTVYTYLLRPTVKGTALSPYTKAFLMYKPEVNANLESNYIRVQ